jgi:DNA-binding PadR family transcriptional regulator
MDKVIEIRIMMLEVLEEGPMSGNMLIRKILERHPDALKYDPHDILYALYISYTEGHIERFVENNVTCYRINGSGG